ncbi:response regulator transcription factor [Streptomyces sp. NPDC091272]|uniref:response regulator transcription factor n=1 Tax=Streptomyces sp. NPDC091272 TaxID=3365981 RepID=UPI00382A8B2D
MPSFGDTSEPGDDGIDHGAQFPWLDGLAHVHLLSERELQVFALLSHGCSNRDIAALLGVTERTVKAHMAQILAKLRLESRLQAGLVAFAHGLPADSDDPAPGQPARRPDTDEGS